MQHHYPGSVIPEWPLTCFWTSASLRAILPTGLYGKCSTEKGTKENSHYHTRNKQNWTNDFNIKFWKNFLKTWNQLVPEKKVYPLAAAVRATPLVGRSPSLLRKSLWLASDGWSWLVVWLVRMKRREKISHMTEQLRVSKERLRELTTSHESSWELEGIFSHSLPTDSSLQIVSNPIWFEWQQLCMIAT